MKILKFGHMGDAHIGKTYLQDSIKSLNFISDQVLNDDELDALLVPGDIWDKVVELQKDTPLYSAINIFDNIAKKKPILMVYGNHDRPNSLEIFHNVNENIYIVNKNIELLYLYNNRFYPLEKFKDSGHPKPNSIFYCIPYPHENLWVDQETILHTKIEKHALDKAIKQELLNQDEYVKSLDLIDVKKIIVAHGSLEGFIQNDFKSSYIGSNYHFSTNTFNSINPDYVALGHIHKFQTLMNGRACYPSSIYSVNFGEKDKKYFCKITFSKDEEETSQFEFEKILIPTRTRIVKHLLWTKEKTEKDFKKLIDDTIQDSKTKIDKYTFEIIISAPSKILVSLDYKSTYDIKIKKDQIESDPKKITPIINETDVELFSRWYNLKYEKKPENSILTKLEQILKEANDEDEL